MSSTIDISPEELAKLKANFPDYIQALKTRPFWPLPGPQLQAYQSLADITFYGGAAGCGKTGLGVGLALTAHRNSLIIRKEATQLGGIKDEIYEMLGNRDGYSGQAQRWVTPDNRVIMFGSVPNPGDEEKYQGRARDYLFLDEICHFPEAQVRFLMGWVRTTIKGQRCRVLFTGNPPTSAAGRWVIPFFGPWLDPNHPNKAEPGELRWYATIDGVDTPMPHGMKFTHKGEEITPMSRTFIPGRISDNPYLMGTNYLSTLQALPEPLRSQMLHGDFMAGSEDGEMQLIPTSWIEEAMARWEPRTDKGAMTSLGVDVSRGGRDETVLAPKYGNWFDELKAYPGSEITTGGRAATKVLQAIDGHDPRVGVDIIGVGSSCYDHLSPYLLNSVIAINSAGKSSRKTDNTGLITFSNLRADMWWQLREKLDPSSGLKLALPPDEKLKADLAAPVYEINARGVVVESKEHLIKRLGRSPDRADAVVYANFIKPIFSTF